MTGCLLFLSPVALVSFAFLVLREVETKGRLGEVKLDAMFFPFQNRGNRHGGLGSILILCCRRGSIRFLGIIVLHSRRSHFHRNRCAIGHEYKNIKTLIDEFSHSIYAVLTFLGPVCLPPRP